METWYLWISVILLPLGYYHSAIGVAQDFWSTYSAIPPIQASTDTVEGYQGVLVNIVPICSKIFQIFFVVSCLYLLERTPDIWRGRRPNRQMTTFYPSLGTLWVNQVYNYLCQIPNVITLSIGMVQAYSTWRIVWLPANTGILWWLMVANIIGISYGLVRMGVRWRRRLPIRSAHLKITAVGSVGLLLCRWTGLPVIKAKLINVLVSVACFMISLWKEYRRHLVSTETDRQANGTLIWRKSNGTQRNTITNSRHTIKADSLKLGDEIWLAYGETTPATIEVVSLDWLPSSESDNVSPPDKNSTPRVGYVDNRESSGEDVSTAFAIGDVLRCGLRLTRPDLTLRGRVVQYRCSTRPTSGLTGLPKYLNHPWSIVDGTAVLLLCGLSLSISGSANQAFIGEITWWSITEHIISTIIAGNILIPSMKMTLLYQVYNLVLAVSFPGVSIQDSPSIPNLRAVDTIIFDKTGTLTTDELRVASNFDEDGLHDLSVKLGWSLVETRVALALANSESNLVMSDEKLTAWGTSPEECEMLNYWQIHVGFTTLWNPLGEQESQTSVIKFKLDSNTSHTRQIKISRRLSYKFQYGKVAQITITEGDKITDILVRQHGSDFYPNYRGSSNLRSMTLSYRLVTDNLPPTTEWEQLSWRLASTYQFRTPLRSQIPQTMKYLWEHQLSTSILTGDGKEAAEATGLDIGFPPKITRVTNLEQLEQLLPELDNSNELRTLSIEGRHLESWLDINHATVSKLLRHPHACRIMSRVPKPLKARVVRASNGPIYVGDAANDLLAIQEAQVGIALRHGAEICRLNSDIIMNEPADLLDLLVPNGYRDMLLRGGELLLADVCWLCGLLAGSLAVGLHYNKFRRVTDTVIYEDTWDPFTMLFISSLQYTLSVIAYVSGSVSVPKHVIRSTQLATQSVIEMLTGLGTGLTLAWGWKQLVEIQSTQLDQYLPDFPRLTLIGVDTLLLIRHSWPSYCRPEPLSRPFGSQNKVMEWRGAERTSPVLMALSILDSIPFRIIWLGIFLTLT